MEKMTKRNMYAALINLAEGRTFAYDTEDGAVAVDYDALKTFAENEIALLDKKAAKAKEYSAKKAKESDELKDAIAAVLTDEFMPVSDILVALNDEDATAARVVYRCNSLVKENVAEKTDIKLEGKKGTVKGYRKIA